MGFLGGKGENYRGCINLYTNFDKGSLKSRTIKIQYLLVNVNTSYNILLGVIVFMPHLVMKFSSTSWNIMIVHVDQRIARECCVTSLRIELMTSYQKQPQLWRDNMVIMTDLNPWINNILVDSNKDTTHLQIHDNAPKLKLPWLALKLRRYLEYSSIM